MTLLQIKILSAFLQPDSFGLFAALRGLSLLVSLLAANGLPQLLIRFLPYHESRRQTSGALLLSGLCFLAPLFLLTVLVFVVESNRDFFFQFVPAAQQMAPGAKDAGVAGNLFLWFYVCTLGVTLKLVLYGGFNGIRRLPAQVTIELVSLAVQVLWIYLWRDRLTVGGLFMILGITSLAAALAGLPWYFYRLLTDTARGGGATSPAGAGSSPGAGDYAGYWVGATGLSLVAVAFTDADRYLLTRVLALEVLAQFHIGSRVLRMANRFLSVPVLSFQPEVTRFAAEQRADSIGFSTRVFFKFNAAVAWMAALTIWAFAPEIVRLVSSEAYAAAVPLLRILVLAMPLTAMTAPLTTVMKAGDRVRHAFLCDLVWACAYLALLVVLGRAFGLVGVGVAHVVASAGQLALAAVLSRDLVPPGFVSASGIKTLACGIAFAPVLTGNIWLPVEPGSAAGLLARIGLLVVSVTLFRLLARVTRVLSQGERDALIDLLDKPVLGSVARRLI
jgi:O-antigen/teichoic acid export membrane protein